MRCTGCILPLLSCLALCTISCLADIALTVPTSIALNVPMDVTWVRRNTDPPVFLLQTIKFNTVISTAQELITVQTDNGARFNGVTGVISRFAGPHIIVALDPATNRIIATSNVFDVGGSTPARTTPASDNTSSPQQNQSGASSKAIVPIGAIVGAVVGGVVALVLGILVYLYFRRQLQRRYGDIQEIKANDSDPSNEKVTNWRANRIPSQDQLAPPDVARTARTRSIGESDIGGHPLSLTSVHVSPGAHPYEPSTSTNVPQEGTTGLISAINSLRTAIVRNEKATAVRIDTLQGQNSRDRRLSIGTSVAGFPPPSYAESPRSPPSRPTLTLSPASTSSVLGSPPTRPPRPVPSPQLPTPSAFEDQQQQQRF